MSAKDWPASDRSRLGRFRDNLARIIATFAFDRIATKRYAARVETSLRLGLPLARGEEKAAAPTVSIEWLRANAARADQTPKGTETDV